MRKTLLDTDIFSEVLKGIDPQVAVRASLYRATFQRYTISTFTVVEIVKGLYKANRAEQLRQFLQGITVLEILTLDVAATELAGRIYADLERTGQPIGRADPLIAAISLRHQLILVTGNTNHYQRLSDLGYPLELDNWRLP